MSKLTYSEAVLLEDQAYELVIALRMQYAEHMRKMYTLRHFSDTVHTELANRMHRITWARGHAVTRYTRRRLVRSQMRPS